ncbi:LysE/ArgO family amino acid transporter [Vibrio hippocampi]|uniref:Arginine exporter protein ArgO n=1 Tax=Vibrio hippocampi TaxID=654686 RepID=A0ABM8ZGV6_9VIBR|nr:LysE/ArgO family amino acid transporter [Vibrio hippocampi]CAH0525885.1 Arginine exporter protein ArgO [Vibrio hippocampi]
MDATIFVTGFSLGFSLILAIGAQNAFVLKQGLKRQHVFAVCLVCALSDALLITLGVTGFGTVVERYPNVEWIARYAGAAFLFWYAYLSFYNVLRRSHQLEPAAETEQSLMKSMLICLGLTWLNPHVYLDTLVLLGSISSQYVPKQAWFGAGAVCASFVFFFSLGYGARLLAPLFKQPKAWKVLELLVGCIMLTIAISLVVGS